MEFNFQKEEFARAYLSSMRIVSEYLEENRTNKYKIYFVSLHILLLVAHSAKMHRYVFELKLYIFVLDNNFICLMNCVKMLK